MKQLKTMRSVDKSRMRVLVARTFESMGIHGKPIGAENVQAQLVAHGINPVDNIFSQTLLKMREE